MPLGTLCNILNNYRGNCGRKSGDSDGIWWRWGRLTRRRGRRRGTWMTMNIWNAIMSIEFLLQPRHDHHIHSHSRHSIAKPFLGQIGSFSFSSFSSAVMCKKHNHHGIVHAIQSIRNCIEWRHSGVLLPIHPSIHPFVALCDICL